LLIDTYLQSFISQWFVVILKDLLILVNFISSQIVSQENKISLYFNELRYIAIKYSPL